MQVTKYMCILKEQDIFTGKRLKVHKISEKNSLKPLLQKYLKSSGVLL